LRITKPSHGCVRIIRESIPLYFYMSQSHSVVVINYNTRELLRACLASLGANPPYPVIVVDNASSDGSADMVRAEFPWVILHANSENLGYGAAANQAIAQCASEYVLLLNSDTRLTRGAFDMLIQYLEQHPRVAIAGPRIVTPNGTLQPSCFPFPTPIHVFIQESTLGILFRHTPILREWYLPASSHPHSQNVPWVLGAALAIRRDALATVGGFDESYFMYFEEVDLCYRLRAIGWHIDFVSDATIVHVGGASTVQQRADMKLALYMSLIRFYTHHYSRWRMQQLRLVLSYSMLRNITLDRIRLARTHDARTRAITVENLSVWHQVLSTLWRDESFGFKKTAHPIPLRNARQIERGIESQV